MSLTADPRLECFHRRFWRGKLSVLVAAGLALTASSWCPASAQEEITVRRFADVVAVRTGAQAQERVLYYFSPTATLREGDEVEQGGGAHSEITLSAAGRVEFHDPAHVVVHKLRAQGDVLRLVRLTRASATSGDRILTLVLPNGARCILDGGQVELRHEFGRLRVRNTGSLGVIVKGAMELEPGAQASAKQLDKIVLAKGEEVRMPYFSEPEPVAESETTDWAGLVVRHGVETRVEPSAEGLRITAHRAAALRVAGVHTRLGAGQILTITNKRASATAVADKPRAAAEAAAPADSP